MDTSNPLLKRESVFAAQDSKVMTLDGTVLKSGILLFLCLGAGLFAWMNPAQQLPLLFVGLLGGTAAFLIAMFKAAWSPVLAPAYALMEGLVLGGISCFLEKKYPGIALNAAMLTASVLAVMLLLFVTRIIRVTQGLRSAIICATAAIFLIYLVEMIIGFFGVHVPYIHEGGKWGIIFSLVVVGIAAFNLLLDFDAVENGVRNGAPGYMEWYCSMALLVTLVWVYLEILNLLMKLRGRD